MLNIELYPYRPDHQEPRTDWRGHAACRFADPELFFPVSASGPSLDQAERARAICVTCPVRRECLQFALATRQAYGVWGGMSEQERGAAASRAALRVRAMGSAAL
jgi:WhiB family transcriptional regulator, redox-sensing transcriptional regulator